MTFAASAGADVRPGALVAPWWRRSRWWFALAGLVLIAAVVMTVANRRPPDRPLDPDSPSQAGSKALAQLLRQRGVEVRRVDGIADLPAGATVLIGEPDRYLPQRLGDVTAAHRTVLVQPSAALLAGIEPALADLQDDSDIGDTVRPDCSAIGPQAAGAVDFPVGLRYIDEPCYDGRVLIRDDVVAFGSAGLLTNDHLAAGGVAALDINLITDNGRVASVSWVVATDDPEATQTRSVWSIFPDWAPRAAWWLGGIGLLTAFWRGRRFAPVVTEPLPVAVRAAEVVEGHGRLYRRAGARDRAGDLLRQATTTRLARRLGLGSAASAATVAAVLDDAAPDRAGMDASRTLLGPPPVDDAGLARLAQDLSQLESADPTPAPAPSDRNRTP